MSSADSFVALRSLLTSSTPQNQFAPPHGLVKRVHSADSAVDYSLPKSRTDQGLNLSKKSAQSPASADDVTSTTDYSSASCGDTSATNDDQGCETSSLPVIVNKKKAAFDLWHKRKLSEMGSNDANRLSAPSHPEVKRVKSENCKIDRHQDVKLFDCNPSPNNADFNKNAQVLSQLQKALLAQPVLQNLPGQIATFSPDLDILSPKLSRHNDAAFYPNIQCILCKEWVCSRNRYMHIESHLQYRYVSRQL